MWYYNVQCCWWTVAASYAHRVNSSNKQMWFIMGNGRNENVCQVFSYSGCCFSAGKWFEGPI